MTNQPVSCIILAGGEGKRFNCKDKGLVELNGKPLIGHAIEAIAPQVDDIVISANRNIDEYSKYTNKVIKDATGDFQGPLRGIITCLPECKHEWILVVPCDIPLLPKDLVQRLFDANNSKLIVAKAHERRQLVFLMHASLKNDLGEFVKQGHNKAMTWIELQNPSVVIFKNERGSFTNLNTPEDLGSI